MGFSRFLRNVDYFENYMKYYELNYKSGERGCPTYLKGDLNHEWEWDEMDPNPEKFEIKNQYVFQAKHTLIELDYWDSNLVSENFVELCKFFGMKYIVVPLKIIQSNKQETQKNFFYLLTSDYKTILDREKSTYVEDTDLETGHPIKDRYFPDIIRYREITRFIIQESLVGRANIFRCIDLNDRYVCSEIFKNEAEKRHLVGIQFVEIDKDFKRSP